MSAHYIVNTDPTFFPKAQVGQGILTDLPSHANAGQSDTLRQHSEGVIETLPIVGAFRLRLLGGDGLDGLTGADDLHAATTGDPDNYVLCQ